MFTMIIIKLINNKLVSLRDGVSNFIVAASCAIVYVGQYCLKYSL